MTDVQNNVRTTFSANVGGFVAPMRGVVSAAESAVGAVRGLANQVLGLPGLLAGIAGGLGLKSIIDVNSEFQNAQRTIGGTFTALGMAGDFNSGLALASQTMTQIERDAAALPGEASDYIQVFQTALPAMNAVSGVLTAQGQSVAQFSNRFAAVANTFGVDMVQAGSDLSRMLAQGRGQVEMMSPTWMRLAPFIRTTAQQMHLTVSSAADFNKLSAEQRALLLQNTVNQGGLNGMLEAAGHSWDAQFGTLQAIGKSMLRLGSAPLFDSVISSLESMNNWLTDNQQIVIDMGRALSSGFVAALGQARAVGMQVFHVVEEVGSALKKSGVLTALQHVGTNVIGAANRAMSTMSSVVSPGGAGDPSALIATLTTTVEPLMGAFVKLSDVVGPIVGALANFSGLVMQITMTLLPPFANLIGAVATPMFAFWGVLAGVVDTLVTNVRPTFLSLATKIGGLVTSIASFLHPAMRLVGAAFGWIADKLGRVLAPVIEGVGEALGWLIDALSSVVSWLGHLVGGAADRILGPERRERAPSSSERRDAASAIGDAVAAANVATTQQQQTQRPTPSGRGGGNVNQDFRGSRFEITQKFAEQFDPDRIAVAFANDVGRIGEYRLQSGLAPLYAVR